jgi:uncharacterized protein
MDMYDNQINSPKNISPRQDDRLGTGQTNSKAVLDSIRKTAENHFGRVPGSHGWDHTLRVYRLCQHIGRVEKVDMDVLLTAAYLHDVGRCYQDASNGAVCHAEKGARMAEPIVKALPFCDDQKWNIVHSIKSHRFRNDLKPQTMEAKVLFDADKLDAIGAVGIARAYLFAGEIGAKLHNAGRVIEQTEMYSENDTGFREYQVKLRKIKDRILTREGRRMAVDRHAYMAQFFKRFIEEYEGER